MLSFRALQPSRFAMVSTFGVGSVVSSSSQQRLLRSVGGVVVPHHRSPITAICRRGRISERPQHPELTIVPLRSRPNASPFWIMLLLNGAVLDHQMIEH